MDAEAALDSLFRLWKKLQHRLSSREPAADQLIRHGSEQVHVKQMNDMVYLVHEPKEKERPQLEIVFFHGLDLRQSKQAHVKTWMSRDDSEFWPQTWLAESFPSARIFTVSYDSLGPLDMYLTAENLLISLTMDDVGVGKAGCPVVFVGHCLGGLILKELCLFASETASQKLGEHRVDDLFSNLKGMFFYGTPQTGSVLGDTLQHLFKGDGAPIEEIQVLKASSARRNQHFNKLKSCREWKTAAIGETRETYLQMLGEHVHVSSEASTRPFVDWYYTLDADHIDICKPKDTIDNGFGFLKQFLKEVQKGGVLEAAEKADFISGREYVVDHKDRAKNLEHQLAQPNIHTIFIRGMSGIGKTTVAQQVFRNLSRNYDILSYIALDTLNRSVSDQAMKEEVIMKVLWQLRERDEGFEQNRSNMIYRLKGRKVLMVLDNVESIIQLKALCTDEWLEGSSSKLIITTNSPSVLNTTSTVFEVELMSDDEARELFNHYAFDGENGPIHLEGVVQQVIDICANHPLSLKVFGGFVRSKRYREEDEWLGLVHKLKTAQEVDIGHGCRIWAKWKVLYDYLPHTEKEMFLDIATFFHGRPLTLVKHLWKRRWGQSVSLDTLKGWFLVDVRKSGMYASKGWWFVVDIRKSAGEGVCIYMHQLLRNLGNSIACPDNESIDKLRCIAEASSQWEEIEDVEGKMETLALGVQLIEHMMVQEKSFLKWNRLQYLILKGLGTTPERLELPKSLVYLRWEQGLFTACPVDFTRMKKLVTLELVDCRYMEILPPSLFNAKELSWLDLEGCCKLRELPAGLSERLEYLGLAGVPLEKLPEDLGRLKKLNRLEVHSPRLTQVPEGVGEMESLLALDLSYTTVTGLPESVGGLKKLKTLALSETRLSSLPDSIHDLKSLEELLLARTCLKSLCPSVGALYNLTNLNLSYTPLETLPDSISWLRNLKTLYLCETRLKYLPDSVGDLRVLSTLNLHGTPLKTVPHSIGNLGCLEELNLSSTQVRTLPSSLGDLNRLSHLSVSSTKWKAWPESLGNLHLEFLEAPISWFSCTQGAVSKAVEVEGDYQEECRSSSLTSEQEKGEGEGEGTGASSSWSAEIEGEQEESRPLPRDETSQFKIYSLAFDGVASLTLNGRCCPQSWLQPLFRAMKQQTPALKMLALQDFILAEEMPFEIGTFSTLRSLTVTGWSKLRELPDSLCKLNSLEVLRLENNPQLCKLPECLGSMPAVHQLTILQCGSLQSMPRCFSRESPLDESTDMGDFSWVTSDSWRLLEYFFKCCGKRVAQQLDYVVHMSKVDEARGNGTRLGGQDFETLFGDVDRKAVTEPFDEVCSSHCKLSTLDSSVDEGSVSSDPYILIHILAVCRFHDLRKAVVLTVGSQIVSRSIASFGFRQSVLETGL